MHFSSELPDQTEYMKNITSELSQQDIDEIIRRFEKNEIGIYAVNGYSSVIVVTKSSAIEEGRVQRKELFMLERVTDGILRVNPDWSDEDTNIMRDGHYIQMTIHGESCGFVSLESYNRHLEEERKWGATKAQNFSLLDFLGRSRDDEIANIVNDTLNM